jgi:cob(I)alamin adenosyltransferase
MKVYTKTGDDGKTSLVGGRRVIKSDLKIDSYGTADELNSFIGLGICYLDHVIFKNDISFLKEVQNKLFNLGSYLACDVQDREKYKIPTVSDSFVQSIENEIDKLEGQLPPLTQFILPGGTKESSYFHVARTVCRRLERQMVELNNQTVGEINKESLKFINRLSDYFFVFSRYCNFANKITDETWKK